MSMTIRPAMASDQATIRSIVRAAGIAPFGLDWPRFLVAEDNGRIVGVGQVKCHRDGARELASLAVVPEYQGRGIGSQIVEALIRREAAGDMPKSILYLMCESSLEGYYRRFGFVRLERREIPLSIGRLVRMGNLFARLLALFSRRQFSIIAMSRPPNLE